MQGSGIGVDDKGEKAEESDERDDDTVEQLLQIEHIRRLHDCTRSNTYGCLRVRCRM